LLLLLLPVAGTFQPQIAAGIGKAMAKQQHQQQKRKQQQQQQVHLVAPHEMSLGYVCICIQNSRTHTHTDADTGPLYTKAYVRLLAKSHPPFGLHPSPITACLWKA